MRKFYRIFAAYRGNQQGLALVEFALIVPLFATLLLGAIEIPRYLHIHQKLDKATFQLADVVSQSMTITEPTLDRLSQSVELLMQPYPFATRGKIIIASHTPSVAVPGDADIRWQYCSGALLSDSAYGEMGARYTLPATFPLNDKEDIIVVELFYNFAPWFFPEFLAQQTIYKRAIYRPRLGALDAFVSDCDDA